MIVREHIYIDFGEFSSFDLISILVNFLRTIWAQSEPIFIDQIDSILWIFFERFMSILVNHRKKFD